jgi:hypothetical protein
VRGGGGGEGGNGGGDGDGAGRVRLHPPRQSPNLCLGIELTLGLSHATTLSLSVLMCITNGETSAPPISGSCGGNYGEEIPRR